jgi:transposase
MSSPETKPLPTIWNVPDPLWETMQQVLAVYDPPKPTGRKRMDQRKALDGILFRMRTGCQWNHLPKAFGDDVSVYRTLRRWEKAGVLDILWAVLLWECEELGGVDWQWQAADGCLGKARGVPKTAKDDQNPRTAKKGRRKSASAPIRPTAPKQASRRACLSREGAARLRSVLPEPTSPM